jgi:hypothetical protein
MGALRFRPHHFQPSPQDMPGRMLSALVHGQAPEECRLLTCLKGVAMDILFLNQVLAMSILLEEIITWRRTVLTKMLRPTPKT